MSGLHGVEDSLSGPEGRCAFQPHALNRDIGLHLDVVDSVDVQGVHGYVPRIVEGDVHLAGREVEVLRRDVGDVRTSFGHRRY